MPVSTDKWPADAVERWPIDRLVPYANNSRTHSETQIDQIAASIREWGFTNPVLVNQNGMIIAGHGRVMAAQRLGLSEIPVMVATGWTETQTKAYVLADNQIPAGASWDASLLALEIGDLNEAGFDLGKIGFGADDLESFLVSDDSQEQKAKADEYETSQVADRFWITIKGPLCDQAKALDRLKAAMADLGFVSVDLGTTASD